LVVNTNENGSYKKSDKLREGTSGVIVITDRAEDTVDVTELPTESFPITGANEKRAFEIADVNPISDEKFDPPAAIYGINEDDVPFELRTTSITVSGIENE
jgi:hypothetical protein